MQIEPFAPLASTSMAVGDTSSRLSLPVEGLRGARSLWQFTIELTNAGDSEVFYEFGPETVQATAPAADGTRHSHSVLPGMKLYVTTNQPSLAAICAAGGESTLRICSGRGA